MKKKLLSSSPPTYSAELAETGVIEVVNQNHSLVEPFAAIADDVFERVISGIDNNMDLYGQQESDEVNDNPIAYSDNSDTTLWKQEKHSQ